MTVAENVRISDMGKGMPESGGDTGGAPESGGNPGGMPENNGGMFCGEAEDAIAYVLEKADFPVRSEKLTEGLQTMLGKDFGGIDLSGGQWQRLAIARGLYRAHDMIILDEPTAAIDPLEEADIYRKFAEISRDKTAFIVTHRLGSARIADRIIVMDAGHIVDMGTHEELMRREGKYREMYQAQAKWYA
ncbi:MAG: ABC transporter ATP-binding protein/permease [Acetatifactor sp.]|nr:ABC transporter ATP-binding protein/permease [Acetatifactor sp.]